MSIHQKIWMAEIIDNFPLRRPGLQGNYLIQLSINQRLICKPGQFFKFDISRQLTRENLEIIETKDERNTLQIKNLESDNEFLRRMPLIARPYSVGLSENKGNKTLLTFLYKILGPGSKRVSELKKGEKIIALGPLGKKYFSFPKGKKRALMVAGGVGLPPLLFLEKQLFNKGIKTIHLFIGANTSEKLPLHSEFEIGKVIKNPKSLPAIFQHLADPRMTIQISTDDGSEGYPGLATDLLENYLEKIDGQEDSIIYTCGPWPMMAKTARIAREHNIPCQACLEEVMGCGIGACQSCVKKIKSNNEQGWVYKLVCRDGPVFDANDVYWEA